MCAMGWVIREKRSRWSLAPWIACFVAPDGKNKFWLRVWTSFGTTWQYAVFNGPAKTHRRISDILRASTFNEAKQKAMDEAKRIYKAFGGKD